MASQRAATVPGSLETSGFAARLAGAVTGGVHFDAFTRGRYATDASFYQIDAHGRGRAAHHRGGARRARDRARGGRAGHPARRRHLAMRPDRQLGLVIDTSRHLNRMLALDAASADAARSSPASCSTTSTAGSSRTGCGSRSTSRPRRARPSAAWPATTAAAGARCATAPCATTCCRWKRCSPTARARASGRCRATLPAPHATRRAGPLCRDLLDARRARGRRGRGALPEGAAPGRRLQPRRARAGPAGTTWPTCWSAPRGRSRSSTAIELKLWPLLRNRVVGVCHFGSFYEAMDSAQHLVSWRRSRSSWSTAR